LQASAFSGDELVKHAGDALIQRKSIALFAGVLLAAPALAGTEAQNSQLSADNLDGKQRVAKAEVPRARATEAPRVRSHNFKPQELPAEPALNHENNRVLDLGPLQQSMLIPYAATPTAPIRLEATYNEPVDLEEALQHAVKYNFNVAVEKESWIYQKWGFYARIWSYLPVPSSSVSLNYSSSHVAPDATVSNARSFVAGQGYPLFAGGSAFYSLLSQFYREKGWGQNYAQSVNDALLSVYLAYNALRLNTTLLQIKAKAVEVSASDLHVNNALFVARAGTKFAVMQSRTQLAADQQELLKQQVTTRQAAITLSVALNAALAANLVPKNSALSEDDIIDERLSIDDLVGYGLKHRPDLRMYELYQIASGRDVQTTASSLYPNVSATTGFAHASTTTDPSTQNQNLSLWQQAIAFNQQTLANQSGAAASVASGAAGSSSNATAGSTAASSASSTTSSSSSSSSSSSILSGSNANAGIFSGLTNTLQEGFSLNWSLPNLGLTTIFNIVSARALSRQSMWQANQALLLAEQQIRNSYLTAVTARAQIDTAAYGVDSSREALRLAQVRLKTGVGTNLELIQAQRDFIASLIAQATSISDSNAAQTQLLHDTGLITVDTIVKGFFPDRPFKRPRIR